MNSTSHYFSSTMRRGWAALIREQANGSRASVNVTLRASARTMTTGRAAASADIKQPVQLFGPGDILGFRPDIVSTTTPKVDVGDFEPNYFPAIELADWDFAWRFTPAPAEAKGLIPWITLIVLKAESRGDDIRPEFQEILLNGRNLPQRIRLTDDGDGALPDLQYAHNGAHAHVTSEAGLTDEEVLEIYRTEPERGVCRLLCTRRLQPGVRYAAFVVPTFKLGLLAGLGAELADVNALELAWEGKGATGLELPYYYRWEFRAGLRGDFEHLVRLLEPRELKGLGTREVDCSAPGLGVRGVTVFDGRLGLEGALRAVATDESVPYTEWGEDGLGNDNALTTQTDIAALINQTDDLLESALMSSTDGMWFEIESATTHRLANPVEIEGDKTDEIYIDVIKVELLNAGDGVIVDWHTSVPTISCLFYRDDGTEKYSFSESGAPMSTIEPGGAISQISVTPFGSGDSVTVSWRTTLPTITSFLEYNDDAGIQRQLNSQSTDPTSRNHWVKIDGLSDGSHYIARIVANLLDGSDHATPLGEISLPIPSNNHSLTLRGLTPGRVYQMRIRTWFSDEVVEMPKGRFALPPEVVPPIYGRWHRARNTPVNPDDQHEWIDQLNLDPRHRMAAGLGAEVIRKQQEALMASAWDQLGDIDQANDILRRSQAGRETTTSVYRRLETMGAENFLQLTAPVQKRVLVEGESGSGRMTAAHFLKTRTHIPAAALDPSFRHIARRRGPIRRRQRKATDGALLARLATGELDAAGQQPAPLGMVRICDISAKLQRSYKPSVELRVDRTTADFDEKVTLTWFCENVYRCVASGGWSGEDQLASLSTKDETPFPSSLGDDTTGYPFSVTYKLTGYGLEGQVCDTATVEYELPEIEPPIDGPDNVTVPSPRDPSGSLGLNAAGMPPISSARVSQAGFLSSGIRAVRAPNVARLRHDLRVQRAMQFGQGRFRPGAVVGTLFGNVGNESIEDKTRRFCDGRITSEQISQSLNDDDPFAPVVGHYAPGETEESVRATLDDWLDASGAAPQVPPPMNENFIEDFRDRLFPLLNPDVTVAARTRKRLPLRGTLSTRFNSGFIGDPLDPIMWAPEFKQAMYEPLRDRSHNLLLPGVEKIAQNTIGLLKSNRRFIESYMCGLNHEFAGELLWREYPTDQRGSYFRQFWDIRGYVLREEEATCLFNAWWTSKVQPNDASTLEDLDRKRKEWFVLQDMGTAAAALSEIWFDEIGGSMLAELSEPQQNLIERLIDEDASAVKDIPERINEAVPQNGPPRNLMNEVVKAVGTRERLDEKLRDITRLTAWRYSALGSNKPRVECGSGTTHSSESFEGADDPLVLVIRGDLLKRYPNASIYAVDGLIAPDGRRLPALAEYLELFQIDGVIAPDGGRLPALAESLELVQVDPAMGERGRHKPLRRLVSSEFANNGVTLSAAAEVSLGNDSVIRVIDKSNTYELRDSAANTLRIFWTPNLLEPEPPIFKATLPPDLTFFGFAFQEEDARTTSDEQAGKYFVIEEPTGEPRFGLDAPSDEELKDWRDLSWKHFGLEDNYGVYLDEYDLVTGSPVELDRVQSWQAETMSAALRAWICFQKPVRIAIHANQMLPPKHLSS